MQINPAVQNRPESANPIVEVHAVCPLCHTVERSMSDDTLAAGGGWRCTRCGQQWDARRLETVAAYAASQDTRARPQRILDPSPRFPEP